MSCCPAWWRHCRGGTNGTGWHYGEARHNRVVLFIGSTKVSFIYCSVSWSPYDRYQFVLNLRYLNQVVDVLTGCVVQQFGIESLSINRVERATLASRFKFSIAHSAIPNPILIWQPLLRLVTIFVREPNYCLPNTRFLESTNQNTNIHTKTPQNKNKRQFSSCCHVAVTVTRLSRGCRVAVLQKLSQF